MKVKDLIVKLLVCNPEAEVFGYGEISEEDFIVNNIKQVPIVRVDGDDIEYNGAGEVSIEYFLGKPIIYLES